jgi:hypothetical protein
VCSLLVCGLTVAGIRAAHADDPPLEEPAPPVDKAAPWLRPWLPPPAPDPNPILADGDEISVQAALGVLLSKFGMPITVDVTAAYGRFITSSKRQALSVEAVGSFNVAIDQVTPQFASLGIGLRRVGRRGGVGFGSVDYERLSVGPAFMSRGSNLDVGLQAELALGALTFKGAGLGLFVTAYLFEPAQMFGPDSLLVVGLGYVHCPVTGLRPSVATAKYVREPLPPSDHPCPELATYRDAIKKARMDAVQVCNESDAQACDAARARVLSLNAQLSACEQNAAPVH